MWRETKRRVDNTYNDICGNIFTWRALTHDSTFLIPCFIFHVTCVLIAKYYELMIPSVFKATCKKACGHQKYYCIQQWRISLTILNSQPGTHVFILSTETRLSWVRPSWFSITTPSKSTDTTQNYTKASSFHILSHLIVSWAAGRVIKHG
jgi:hypothetical protein